jgi:hypothetical protein
MVLSVAIVEASPVENVYQVAQAAIRSSVPPLMWAENERFVSGIRERLKTHPLLTHPFLLALQQGKFNREQLKTIHLEYRHAIVEIFTDTLLAAQLQAQQLEPRLKRGSKLYARFILGLNLFDEYGFQPGTQAGGYQGDPNNAHYLLFEQVLDELEISVSERETYVPSQSSRSLRQALEGVYHDLTSIVALLAIAEAAVAFTMSLRDNAQLAGLAVDKGFFKCHGFTYDEETVGCDDFHELGLWYVLMQALTPDQYPKVLELGEQYCDLWAAFYDAQMQLLQSIEPRHTAADSEFALPALA